VPGPSCAAWSRGNCNRAADTRFKVYAATLRASIEFLPFGSGLSTFGDVFLRFQEGIGAYMDYAHNDYLQAFMELGFVAPVVVALLIAAYVMRMWELLRAEGGRSFTLLQLGAGLGMLPMILHSVFDFALHMPANAMWFATLAGIMFHKGYRAARAFRQRGSRAGSGRADRPRIGAAATHDRPSGDPRWSVGT
jgi:O-antigen ligase